MSTTESPARMPAAEGTRPIRRVVNVVWAGAKAIVAWLWSALGTAGAAVRNVVRWPVCHESPMGVTAIVLWLILFTAGMAVNSSAFVDALELTIKTLQEPIGPVGRFVYLIWGLLLLALVLFTYTASNVAILCLLSSQIGVFASRMFDASQRGVDELPISRSRYQAALAGGFLIFLVVMSGSYTILSLPFQTPPVGSNGAVEAQNQYKTLATLASIACLIEGFQPFAIPTVNRWLRGKPGVEGAAPVPAGNQTEIVTPSRPINPPSPPGQAAA